MAITNPTELIKRIAVDHDRKAFRLLVEQYSSRLHTYALVLIKNHELAEEIVSDVWLKIWRNREQLLNIDSLLGYLYISVKNQSYTYRNRIERNPTLGGDYALDSDSPNQVDFTSPHISLEQKELRDLLDREISQLSDACQEAFRLVREEGNSYQEAARKMDISVNTLKTHLRRAVKKLRLGLVNRFSDQVVLRKKTKKNH